MPLSISAGPVYTPYGTNGQFSATVRNTGTDDRYTTARFWYIDIVSNAQTSIGGPPAENLVGGEEREFRKTIPRSSIGAVRIRVRARATAGGDAAERVRPIPPGSFLV